MKKSEIITAIIAIYGAVLSTITILRQYFSDRIKVTVTVGKNRQVVGDPRYHKMTLTVITVTNIGKRPVTITTFGAIGLHPHRNMVVSCLSWKWRKRSSVKIAERTYEERAQALHC
jgi:hypothetical protein